MVRPERNEQKSFRRRADIRENRKRREYLSAAALPLVLSDRGSCRARHSSVGGAAVRKNRRLCARILKIAALPASYIISHLCIMGFGTLSYSANRDLFLILIITCLLYCAALSRNRGGAVQAREAPKACHWRKISGLKPTQPKGEGKTSAVPLLSRIILCERKSLCKPNGSK